MSFARVGISSGGARWCRKRQEPVIVCYGKERVKRETGAACAGVRVRVCARGDLVYKEVLVIVVSVIHTASSRTGALILVLVLVLDLDLDLDLLAAVGVGIGVGIGIVQTRELFAGRTPGRAQEVNNA